MQNENRILHYKWDLYDTRHVVYKTKALSATELKEGYDWAYRSFYSWTNIWKASWQHGQLKHVIKHFTYAGGWKKFEPLWDWVIRAKRAGALLPALEAILSGFGKHPAMKGNEPEARIVKVEERALARQR